MKRIVQLLILLSAYSLSAQVKIGMRIAPQLTWSSPDNKNTFSNGTRMNVSYGLMLDYYFTDNYAIGTELAVSHVGTNQVLRKESYSQLTYAGVTYTNLANLSYDYRMRYFQIPILVKMRTKEIGYNRFYAEFGFNLSILTTAKADMKTTGLTVENMNVNNPDDVDAYTIAPTNYQDDIATLRGGLIFGAGIQRDVFDNSLLQLGLRFENGITNYAKESRWNSYLNYVALQIGFLF